jgi:AcrR family transcriptional regulator
MSTRENAASADDKRERILRAAREEAETCGVSAARMDEVAARAGVSKGTLYRFFQSKEDLFLAMMIGSYEEGLRLVDAGVGEGVDPATGLAGYLDGLVKVLATVSKRMNVHYQAWGVIANDARLKERLFGFLRAFHEARAREVQALVADGQAAGLFDPDASPRSVSDAVGALLSGFLYRSTFDPMGASPEALRACFTSVIEGGLRSRR